LQKYQKICQVLELIDDEKQFEEIIKFISNSRQNESSFRVMNTTSKKKYGEKDFEELTEKADILLENHSINSGIISNKDNIADFWNSLDGKAKEEFTIFELNVMLYLISNQYNKYMKKDKKRIISFLTDVVKAKRMEKSYNDIQV
jgi:hypothetical protein